VVPELKPADIDMLQVRGVEGGPAAIGTAVVVNDHMQVVHWLAVNSTAPAAIAEPLQHLLLKAAEMVRQGLDRGTAGLWSTQSRCCDPRSHRLLLCLQVSVWQRLSCNVQHCCRGAAAVLHPASHSACGRQPLLASVHHHH
jgi:hypothetical protein